MKISKLSYISDIGFSRELPEINASPSLVLIFGHSAFLENPEPFQQLQKQYPHAIFMGCSTAGEILDQNIQDQSLAIALIEFESAQLQLAYVAIDDPQESRHSGRLLADQLRQHNELRSVFVLSDGLCVNGSQLVAGLNDVLSKDIIVTGGLAADGEQFQQTWVLQNGKPTTHIIAALGLYGNVTVKSGSQGGWVPFGPAREVTRSEGNVLYELAHQPALRLYKTYLGDMATGLPATGLRFPLALIHPESQQELVRTILATDEATQSLTFAGDIPVGAQAQLMRANIEQLVDGAEGAASMTATQTQQEVLCISISCVGRRMVMGMDAEEEVEAILDILPSQTTQIGFYSYGEISPFYQGRSDLHNQTMTLTTIYE